MSKVTVYTAAEAQRAAKVPRHIIDGACATGALVATNIGRRTKKSWRILDDDLRDWIRRGYPVEVAA